MRWGNGERERRVERVRREAIGEREMAMVRVGRETELSHGGHVRLSFLSLDSADWLCVRTVNCEERREKVRVGVGVGGRKRSGDLLEKSGEKRKKIGRAHV